jgi:hypothetical protein
MGCSYTGSAGGASVTEIANWPNEAAGMASSNRENNNTENSNERIPIKFRIGTSFCPIQFSLPVKHLRRGQLE